MNTFLTSDKSIYLQISEIIETDILHGILLEDEKVPSTNELTKQYTINPATAAKGISLLVAEGILYKKGASECSFPPAPGNRFLKTQKVIQRAVYPEAAAGSRQLRPFQRRSDTHD